MADMTAPNEPSDVNVEHADEVKVAPAAEESSDEAGDDNEQPDGATDTSE